MRLSSLLADVVAIFHAGYVLFVVAGLLAILIGWWRGWQWVRNFWFRLGHLVAMVVVAVETALGWTCPLTDLEKWLRLQAGEESYGGDFLSNVAHRVLFWEFPDWVFGMLHVGVAMIIVLVFVCVPPRRPFRQRSP